MSTCYAHAMSKCLCMYNTCTVHVFYMYSTCTVHVQYMYSTCTVHVLYMYSTCTVHVHHVYNAKVPELEKLIFITCKSADSGKMLAILGG